MCPQRLPDISNETAALERMPKGRLEYLKRLLPYLKNQSEDCLYLNVYAPIQGRLRRENDLIDFQEKCSQKRFNISQSLSKCKTLKTRLNPIKNLHLATSLQTFSILSHNKFHRSAINFQYHCALSESKGVPWCSLKRVNCFANFRRKLRSLFQCSSQREA